MARCAQPYLGFYTAFLRPHGFKSLINLRGENTALGWWRKEKRVTQELGIAHFDVKLSSRNLLSRSALFSLMEALERAPTPLLLKCSGGQDRTSLAAAVYLLGRYGPAALGEAQAQFAFWPYLHRPKKNQRWLKQFPAFAAGEVRGMRLIEWARSGYDPVAFAAWLAARGLPKSFGALQAE